jgi:hypothetical protein
MAADDGQLKLRLPQSLKTIIEERAQRNHRTINGEVLFLLEQAVNPSNQHDIKVLNLKNGYRRIVYGKLVNMLDLDYSQDLDTLKKEIELGLQILSQSSFRHKIAFLNKEVLVYKGGHHIDVVDDGKGSLNWLMVEDHFVADDGVL